ncbi:hypothetical protein K435DRAFT_880912 [Dendrothele bispora CBS 962.96]|uniref:3'-5' exonuclease domain-containing protein n=1 Tax=Dendrothele bispora (strain CBS 962.96) TaxID=1314807 RepID=A0A4S8KIY4_DENBC|nr:hypothetical protein K435DRAFT_880912 [Dendrothele bispora CBS 962.96]
MLKTHPAPYIDLGIGLTQYLRKDSAIQLSDWSQSPLTSEQQIYAALDAYVSWCIWNKLSKLPSVGLQITKESIIIGQPISLYSGRQIVAHGIIATQPQKLTQYPSTPETDDLMGETKYINITRTRIAVTIEEVLKPGHPPATVDETSSVNIPPAPDPESLIYQEIPIPSNELGDVEEDEIDNESSDDSDDEYGALDVTIAAYPDPNQNAEAQHSSVIDNPVFAQSDKSDELPSRTLEDLWHVMHGLNRFLPRGHSAFKSFARHFKRILLVPVREDEDKVRAVFESKGIAWKTALRAKPDAIQKRIRYVCPPPERLAADLYKFFECWQDVICSKDPKLKLKLFNETAWKQAAGIVEAARRGLLSDPPGIPLYYVLGLRDGFI